MMQTILITGATGGIGRETALALAREGHRVFATGRNSEALGAMERDASGTRLETLRLDVNNPESVESCARTVLERTEGQGVDVLVNNAGYGQMGPLLDVTDEQLRRQFETNVFGLMRVSRAFIPTMLKRRRGRIINISSGGGRLSFPLAGAYTATKFAVEAMSDALRWELAPFGLHVVVIEPGPINTQFAETAANSIGKRERPDSPYASVYGQVDVMKVQAEKMGYSPSTVVRAIRKAALARRPSDRYTAPWYLGLVLWLTHLVPTRVMDFIMRQGAGLTKAKLLIT